MVKSTATEELPKKMEPPDRLNEVPPVPYEREPDMPMRSSQPNIEAVPRGSARKENEVGDTAALSDAVMST